MLPSPQNLPIDTFVVLMMENRSFDHYFGWHPKADGENAGLSYPGRRRQPGRRPTTSPPTSRAATSATPTTPGTAAATSTTAARWTASCRATRPGRAATHTRPATTSRRTSPLHPLRGRRLHALRPLVLLDHGLDLPQPPLPVAAPRTGGHEGQPAPVERTDGFTWETIFDRAISTRPHGPLLLLRPARSPALYGQRGLALDAAGLAVLHRRRGRASCRTSPSSTRRS